MTSILTNISAMAALHTLRGINSGMSETQAQVSSGLRIQTAADNAAYWSISTTMRSDNKAISAVVDALGLGAAKLDLASAGMDNVVDLLGDFKARLIAAKEPGVDTAKIQTELDQLKQEVLSVATSSSFNGVNYLNTNIPDMYDASQTGTSIVSSFVRSTDGGVSVKTMDFDLNGVSLFNSTGGGLLQADPRDVDTLGGLRFAYMSGGDSVQEMSTWSLDNAYGSGPATRSFMFTGPMDIAAGETMTFDVIVDVDNPLDGISPAYDDGTSANVIIDQSVVNAALGVSDGHIETYVDYTRVLNHAFTIAGANARAVNYTHPEPPDQRVIYVPTIDVIGIARVADPSKNGSSFEIKNLVSTFSDNGGFTDTGGIRFGTRNSTMTLDFKPFEVKAGVIIDFDFTVDEEAPAHFSFDKDYINTLLGKTDGIVETAAEMAVLLRSFIPNTDIIIEDNGTGGVTVKTDVLINRKSGEKSGVQFTGVSVNIEPIPRLNFMDIDIEANPGLLTTYLDYVEIASNRIIDAASQLGALTTRVEMQSDFAVKLMDTIDKGVGRLVDADMNEASTRLKALQTQEQLAIQSLSIANSNSDNVMQLFR
ncbi:flagellin [Pararhizobium arenae]|uniref:flagellin N-terminal helical domain-containing protein n=1 Tax=Pararhizobium arenae TaxID=1856850 RepID=UPI00094AD51E|nr:flagellin [Pararhizobium arenae]